MELIQSYKSLCTEFYDLDKPIAETEAFEFYLKKAKESYQPVLEPMCGSGRFLIPLLEHGIEIEGLDASSEMLGSCKRKCREKNLKPVLYYQSLTEMILPKQYGLVFIPSGSFGLITGDKDIKESLKRISSCLIPNGKLILEIETPDSVTQNIISDKREVRKNGNVRIELSSESDFNGRSNIQITDYVYRMYRKDELIRTESETISTRHYRISEFFELLNFAGFSEIKSLIPFTMEKASDKDEMIMFSCVK